MLKLTVSSVAIAAAFLTSASATARTISIPFNASNFSAPLTIDNIYFPLIAGTVYTYRADTKDGCEVDVVTVTYETRDLDGVTTRKVHDSVFDGDACTTDSSALTEDTFDFYAQDDPRSGDTYRQEFAPDVAEDQATVTAVGVTARLMRDDAIQSSFANCLVTKEFTVLEKGATGSKTYCPEVGVVIDIDHHGKIARSELVSISGTANALKFRTPPKP